MNLIFEIREQLLVASALFRRNREDIGWKELKNRLWNEYRESYNFFSHYEPRRLFSNEYPLKIVDKVNGEVANLMKKALSSREFSELYKKTESYKDWLSSEWKDNKEQVERELSNILRIKLPEQEVKVLVVHPSVGGGFHIEKGLIFWGDKEYWQNYNIVYLAHEFLHEILDSSELQHAIIEPATDNELRIRLNGGSGEYFKEEGKEVGHNSLIAIEEALLPKWKEYLNNSEKNIFGFIKSQQRKTEYSD